MSPARPTEERGWGGGRRGFSLVEAVLAMGIAAVLLVGMGGAITMSMTALDQGQDGNAAASAAAVARDRVLADLNEVTTVVNRASGGYGIGCEVGDRDQDGEPDPVVYAWTGTRTTPLYRSVNGEAASLLAPRVDAFSIDILSRTLPATASAEMVLASYSTSVGAVVKTATITASKQCAQYIKPAFADNVDSWSITRIQVRVTRDILATGTLRISLVRAVNWQPIGALLSRLDIPEGALPAAAGWYDVAVSAGPLLPSEGVFITLEDAAGLSLGTGTVEYGQGGLTMPYNTYWCTSGNGGSTWTAAQDTMDMRFNAFGTVTSH